MKEELKKSISIVVSLFVILNAIVISPKIIISVYAANVNDMYPVDSTYTFLKSVEGCSEQCFWDVKQWTIGYGNKCPYDHSSNGSSYGQKGGHHISEADARALFNEKLTSYVNTLKSNCSGLSMNQNQFDALLSATYNHGNVNNCPLKYFLQGKLSESEARSQYYEWCINKGTSTEKGLRERRKKEADLFFSGSLPILPTTMNNQNYAIPATVNASHKIYTYNEYGNQESGRWIDQGDKCYIDAVYVNSYVHVQYPTNGSSEPNRWTYAKLDDFTDVLPTIKQKPTGYNIKVSSANIYDCESLGITITPYEDNFTNIRIYLVYPDGKVVSKDFGTTKSTTVNPTKLGVWKIYARIDNAYGSYEGSTSNGCVSVNVSRPNMGSKVDLGSDFYAYIINKDSGNALTNDNDNVSSKTLQSSTNQRWHFKKQSDGSYQIESVSGNGKCLDAYSGKGRSKDNVQVYKKDNEPVQQWWIYFAGSEVYYLMPTCSGSAVLDVDGGSSNSGANVQIWAYNQSAAQKFEIRKIGSADISLSSSSVSLDLCGTNTSTVNITANGNLPSSYHFSANRDTSAMDTTWGGWSGSTSPITIKGKKAGTYDLKISLVDGNTNQTITTKTITVNISCSHSFGAWTTTKQATCTAEGISSRTCSHCGKVETKTIPKTDHQYLGSVTQPTCSSQGYTTYTCTKCQHSYVADYKPATGQHTFNTGGQTITKEPTCTKEGTRTQKCTVCGKEFTNSIPAKGHLYVSTVVKPTCTEQGYTVHSCFNGCGSSYKDSYTAALSHNFGSWTTTKQPTCTSEGTKTRTCSRCNKSETQTVPKLDHDYKATVIAPTTTSQGYTLHKCSRCGNEYKDNYKDKLTPVDANSPQIVAEKVSGSAGSIINYKISVKNNPGIVGVRFNVSYDTSVLTLQETKGGIFKDTTFGSLTSPLSVVWGDSIHDDNKTNGTVVELVFKVKDTAKSGNYPIKITYDADDIFNSNLENVNFTVVNGSINVVDHIPGDVNGDGNVNMKDYAVLQRYLNNWNVTIVKNAADVNADGSVNMKDYALLQRYLNGWNIQLK